LLHFKINGFFKSEFLYVIEFTCTVERGRRGNGSEKEEEVRNNREERREERRETAEERREKREGRREKREERREKREEG
jgi:hypothetical protein